MVTPASFSKLLRLYGILKDMLQLSDVLINRQVLSLRTGAPVATALEPIINPNNLKIEGWYCQDRFSKEVLILLEQDVRDIIKQGIVIDDHSVLVEADELIRLKEVLEYKFELLQKPVVSTNKKRIGKVEDYAVEVETLYIQKIYVTQSIMKSFSGGSLSVDREQITEITNRKIVIQDPQKPVKAGMNTAPATS